MDDDSRFTTDYAEKKFDAGEESTVHTVQKRKKKNKKKRKKKKKKKKRKHKRINTTHTSSLPQECGI